MLQGTTNVYKHLSALFFQLVLLLATSSLARAVVISEIHYNPPGGENALEFVEISNDSTTPEDISGYFFTDGIEFQIPAGTILAKGDILVLCADVDAVRTRWGIHNAIGNFSGRLDNAGERLTLVNQVGVTVQSLRFRDRGKWPAEADGTGHTLVLRGLRLDSSEPESWTWSPELGGSPGRPNFVVDDEPQFEDVVLIEAGELWRFSRGSQPFSSPPEAWRAPDFDDATWEEGPSGFGYGDNDDATVLEDMQNSYTSVACRKTFTLTPEDLASGELNLGMVYDDGFCAFINGVSFASVNCTPEMAYDAVATGSHEARGEEEHFAIPQHLLLAGVNVLAVVGYNNDASSLDFSLLPRLLARRRMGGPDSPLGAAVVCNELYRSPIEGESWVELYNRGRFAVDLSGFQLTDDPDRADPYTIAAGRVLAPGGFLVIDEFESGLTFSSPVVRVFLLGDTGIAEAAAIFERPAPPGLEIGEYAEARFPDGGPLEWVTATPTRESANQVEGTTDIVINEIFYHPPDGRSGEFLEFYNRGNETVDLSGYSIDKGVTYEFADGVTLERGGYLVVAEDPELILLNYGRGGALGPWEGTLADDGENIRVVDAWGNPVDEVRFHDGGHWSRLADGEGSSLELIDPFQDNDVGSAWGASDETGKSRWERLSYTVPDYRPAAESELHLLLVERGSCLIDEVSIRRGGGSNHIPNSGFESSTSPWIIEGTHQDSRRVTYDSYAGRACLELNASGKGDTSVNRIETETSPALTRGAYEVSLWARWLSGSSLLVGHGEFSAGPWGGRPSPSVNMSGNTLGGRLRLTVPLDLGTPGEENSRRRRLLEESGSANLGPVISDVTHSPPSPDPETPVRVSARVSDSDGVESVRLFFRERHAGGAFDSVPLVEEPRSADGTASARVFAGQLAGFSRGVKIVFFVEATDTAGASRRFPVDAPGSTLLFQVQGVVEHRTDAVKIVLDDARTQELAGRRIHSNHLVDGAFVFDDDEVYYNVGVRYRGSPWGRPERASYRVRIPKDELLHPGLRKINLSSRVNGPVELASYFLVGRCGTVDKPAAVPLYHFVSSYFNGGSRGIQRLFEPVARDFVDKWFPGSDGAVLKATARLAFNDSGQHTAYDGASFDYMGEHPENYRFYYFHVTDRSRDDWERFMELMRVMDPRETSDSVHDNQIGEILDVEGFLRVMVPRMFVSDWDTLGIGQGHNAYLILDSRDGLWETAPLDFNQAMPSGQLNFPVFPTFDRGYARLISRPPVRRIYARIADEFLDGYWSTTRAGPFLDAVQRDTGVSMSEPRSFIGNRAPIVRRQIEPFTQVPFRIVTNGGDDIATGATRLELEGEASVEIASLLVVRNAEAPMPLEPTWDTPTRWRARFDLPVASNQFRFLGFDARGTLVATAIIRITTSAWPSEPEFLRGDANGDQVVDVSDPVATLRHLFAGLSLDCQDAADSDDNGRVELSDAIGTLGHLFRRGAPPAPPYPSPGVDPSPDELNCEL